MSSSTESPSEISINIKGPQELKIQITITTDKTVMDLKRAIAEKSDVEAERQRLIYSGKVLRDEDVLSQYKIQSSHTIHMVKGAARNNAGSSTSTPQPLPAMQAGQNPSDPLTVLNGPMGHGLMAGFNPFASLGVNPNDPNMLQGMMESPQFLQQMSSLMSNPEILDQVIASNPQLQEMGPQIREIFQSEQFRQIMSNPESLRMMMQMSAMLRGSGLGGGVGGGARGPGLFGAAQQQQANAAGLPSINPSFNPSAWPPFPPAPQTNTTPSATGEAQTPGGGLFNPALLQQLLTAAPGGGGLPGMGGFGAPVPSADTRPAEERFQVQLGQLQDMGFTNASQNIRALLATGGNVHSAIEYILGGGGL